LRKIEKLIAAGASPNSIYYLTFANSIVDAFSTDIAKPQEKGGLGIDPAELGIHISTLHSLAFKVVKTYATRLSLPDHVELIDPSSRAEDHLSQLVVSDLYEQYRLTHAIDKRTFNKELDQLRATWQKELPVSDALAKLATANRLLESKYHLLPWDRLVPIANDAISRFGLPRWLQEASHFLIDEFQDFNPSEQRHIQLITEPSDSVVIVGDVDQSIYSGRSASPSGLRNLLNRGDITTVTFVLCRRCPRRVVEGANKILSMIDPAGYTNRTLAPYKTEDGALGITSFKSCKEEVDVLARQIQAWQQSGRVEIILLFPNRKVLGHYKQELESRGIRCEARASSERIDAVRALLKLAVLRDQPLLERSLIACFSRLEKRFVVDVLPLLATSDTLHVALETAARDSRWQRAVREEYDRYVATRADLTSGDAALVRRACGALGHEVDEVLIQELLAEASDTAARDRIEAILAKHLYPEEAPTSPGVRLLTMHSSKGLSKGIVVMPGLEDKWMPGLATGDSLEERHRLFYVALTRAEQGVIITYPKTRARRDPLNYTPVGSGPGLSRYANRLRLP